MANKKLPDDEKFEKQDFNLFDALAAIDKKDYQYFDKLSDEQQKKFVPYMITHWVSAIKGSEGLSRYYVMSVNEYANKYLFNENIQKHPKLQWMMLCSASPGLGKQFHQWIPNIGINISKLREPAKLKEIKEYFGKIYSKTDESILQEISEVFVKNHKRKVYLSKLYPNLKLEDIETLNELITDEDIAEYEKEQGN